MDTEWWNQWDPESRHDPHRRTPHFLLQKLKLNFRNVFFRLSTTISSFPIFIWNFIFLVLWAAYSHAPQFLLMYRNALVSWDLIAGFWSYMCYKDLIIKSLPVTICWREAHTKSCSSFTVSGLMWRSLVHLDLSFYKTVYWFHSSVYLLIQQYNFINHLIWTVAVLIGSQTMSLP